MLSPLRVCRLSFHPTPQTAINGFRLNTLYTLPSRRSFASEVVSPPPKIPHQRPRVIRRAFRFARYTGYFLLSSAFGVLAIGGGIFVHDAFTYSDKHLDRVPVSPLALHPERGGPKNLPLVRVQVDDEDDDENRKLTEKPRLVIVGGGWGVRLSMDHPHTITE